MRSSDRLGWLFVCRVSQRGMRAETTSDQTTHDGGGGENQGSNRSDRASKRVTVSKLQACRNEQKPLSAANKRKVEATWAFPT